MEFKRICVFCGSNSGNSPAFEAGAELLGKYLASNSIELVYGGGRVGLMGKIADTVLENGGKVNGMIPKSLADKEIAHQGLTELHVVSSMHERKALMADYSDGFIAMPGGFGTFEEICEVITWSQLGFHRKPCGLLNVEGYYDPMLALFDQATKQGFIRPEHRELVKMSSTVEDLMKQMEAFEPDVKEKWIDRESS